MRYNIPQGGDCMNKNIACNVRLTEDERRDFKMAALANNTTVQDILYKAVKDYITNYFAKKESASA
jgi:hypothetical protein